MIRLILCLGAIHFVSVDFDAVEAYTGGPIRATVGWYDADERKVYYRLFYLDDSGNHGTYPYKWCRACRGSDWILPATDSGTWTLPRSWST